MRCVCGAVVCDLMVVICPVVIVALCCCSCVLSIVIGCVVRVGVVFGMRTHACAWVCILDGARFVIARSDMFLYVYMIWRVCAHVGLRCQA